MADSEVDVNETSQLISRTTEAGTVISSNKLFDPRQPYLKWIALFFLSSMSFGSYYCSDNPAGLQDVMKEDLKISSSAFTSFYAWYSWPNVILALVGGVLIDKWLSVARGATIFCGFITVGQIVFGIGGFFRLIWLMNAGRFISGIGADSLWTAQYAGAVAWFPEKQLNFVFGIQILFSRIGSIIGVNTIRPIYDSLSDQFSGPKRIGITLLIAVSTCIFSLLCALVFWLLDNRRRRVLCDDNTNGTADEFHFRDVRQFSASLYCLYIICVFYYGVIYPFMATAQLLFESKYDLSPDLSNACNSMVNILSGILSPVLGYVIDRTGRNINWLILSIIATIVSHLLLAFLFIHPIIPLILMGIAYAILAASLWPLVALIVPKQILGTAYGLMQSILSLGLGIINILTGFILDKYGYFMLEIFFILCLDLALLATVFLYVWNSVKKGKCNDSAAIRIAEQHELEKTT